jgi:hypothetical protein
MATTVAKSAGNKNPKLIVKKCFSFISLAQHRIMSAAVAACM